MAYYMRGDYATGGYGYGRGDPGFLSKLWKGVKGIVIPAAATMLGGPVLGGLAAAGMSKPTPGIIPTPGRAQPQQQVGVAVGPMRFSSTDFYPPVPQFVGGRMPAATAHEKMAMASSQGGCCPVGYHLDKRTGTRCVRNRRMNIANPRALRRAMRRVQGFEKLAKRTITFTRRTRLKKK